MYESVYKSVVSSSVFLNIYYAFLLFFLRFSIEYQMFRNNYLPIFFIQRRNQTSELDFSLSFLA